MEDSEVERKMVVVMMMMMMRRLRLVMIREVLSLTAVERRQVWLAIPGTHLLAPISTPDQEDRLPVLPAQSPVPSEVIGVPEEVRSISLPLA